MSSFLITSRSMRRVRFVWLGVVGARLRLNRRLMTTRIVPPKTIVTGGSFKGEVLNGVVAEVFGLETGSADTCNIRDIFKEILLKVDRALRCSSLAVPTAVFNAFCSRDF